MKKKKKEIATTRGIDQTSTDFSGFLFATRFFFFPCLHYRSLVMSLSQLLSLIVFLLLCFDLIQHSARLFFFSK